MVECSERIFKPVGIHIPHYENDPGSAVVARPLVHMDRRMNEVLRALKERRPRQSIDRKQTLDAQNLSAMAMQQHCHPDTESRPIERLIEHQTARDDVLVTMD